MGDVGGDVLPSGTVTMLFSDIEASTKMVHALGASWAQVLEQQRRLCRRAWARHGGVEMGTEGDSFFVVFASPRDAVAAGLRVQTSITAATWPEGAVVRLRMGIHTGTPTRHADGYVGMDVHRGARVAAAAHGGQLLVSEPTMRLVAEALPAAGVVSLDLGEHQLKDIPTRTRLFQLDLSGREERFPPLRTLGGAGSLPTALRDGLREVVGRDGEVAEVAELLAGGTRLVTLTGPGGVGKTTLATAVSGAVAERFPDGVFVAPMAGVTSAAGMWASMSQVLDVPPDGQVPPGFFVHVRDRRILLVLDNLEQIADADEVVHDLVDQAPHVSVVATSRRTLHVAGEHEHAVAGLEPDDAVQLFARHAARARRGFVVDESNRTAVEQLCAALDRLPLALEIAAARVKVLSPQAMLARIDSSLDLALRQRGSDDRQATLRVTIAWSYDLLDAVRRDVLNHLGVFVGGAPLDAVEAVVGPDVLAGEDLLDVLFDLVDQSMVVVSDTAEGEPRFHLLETVRRFALARLADSGRRAVAEQRHGQYYLDLVRSLGRDYASSGYRAARAAFLVELPNVDAMLARPEVALVWDDTPMPPAHRHALAATAALDFRLVEDTRQWARAGLESCLSAGEGQAGDLFARCWLTSVAARTEMQHGSAERAHEVAVDGHGRWVSTGAPPEGFPWRSATAVVTELLYVAARGALDSDDLATAEHWYELLREATAADDDAAATLLALRLGFWITAVRGDVTGSQRLLLDEEAYRRTHGLAVDPGLQNNLADAELNLGRRDLAHARLADSAGALLDLGDPYVQAIYAETMAAVVGLEHPAECVRTYGSASVFRVVEGIGNDEYGVAEDERVLTGVRPLLTPADYDAAWEQGRAESLADRVREMAALPTVGPGG